MGIGGEGVLYLPVYAYAYYIQPFTVFRENKISNHEVNVWDVFIISADQSYFNYKIF